MLPKFSLPVKRFRALLSGVACFLSFLYPAETYGSTDHLEAVDPLFEGTSVQCPPENTVVEAQNQVAVDAAFTDWLAQFTYDAGCESVTFLVNGQVVDILNLTPPDFCGDSLTLTLEASCNGEITSCERTFVTRPVNQEIVISLPVVDFSCFNGPEIPDIEKLLPAYTLSYLIDAFAILPACVEVDQLEMNTTVEGPFVSGKEVTYLRTYFLSAGGVPFETAIHVLTFTYDPNPPFLIGLPDDLDLQCGSPVPEWPVVTALDAEDGTVDVITHTSALPCGGLIRTWEARDLCGNLTSGYQKITFACEGITNPVSNTRELTEKVPAFRNSREIPAMTIYPNPFREFISLHFRAPDTGDARISIYDQFGRALYTQAVMFNQGLNEKQLKTGHLPSGLYRIEITTSHYSEGQMVIRP